MTQTPGRYPFGEKAEREQERICAEKRAKARELWEAVHGRPPNGDLVENCPIDLHDTEDLEILHSIWADIAREEQAKKQ
jgi:hypothetical protein